MRLVLASLAVLLSPLASAQDARTATFDGQLDALDDTLTTGEALDRYRFDVEAGQTVTVELVSDAFDPWLVLKRSTGANIDNDDWNGSRRVSRIVTQADSAGTFEALVTTYAPGMTGAYRLTVSKTPAPNAVRLGLSTGSPDGDFFGGASLAGTVWAQDCPGAAVSRRYLALGPEGTVRLSDTSDAELAEAPGARWSVADGTLTIAHSVGTTAYTLTEAPVLAGVSPDVCGDTARLLRLR